MGTGTVSRPRGGLIRPRPAPVLWAALTAWLASRGGTELALISWVGADALPLVAGVLAVLALVGLAYLMRSHPSRAVVAIVAAVALGVALLHGVWLVTTVATLEARGPARWQATVVRDPVRGPYGLSVTMRLDDAPLGLSVLVSWPKQEKPPSYGQRFIFWGRLRAIVRSLPASADAFRRGQVLRSTPWRVSADGWAPEPLGTVAVWRAHVVSYLSRVGDSGSEVLASMLFGVPVSGAGTQAMEDARTAGVAWAITASGLHLAALVALVERICGLVRLKRRDRTVVSLAAIAVIAMGAGLRVSLLRAALAACAGILARLLGRRRDATAALGVAAIAFLVSDPSAAYDIGLMLGGLALTALVLLGPLARAWLRPVLGRVGAGALGSSVAAAAGVAPLSAALFGGVATVGPVALLVSGAPVEVAVACGFIGALLLPGMPAVGATLLKVGAAAASAAAWLWSMAVRLPNAFIAVGMVPWWGYALWAGLAVAAWCRWPEPRRASRVRLGAIVAITAVLIAGLVTISVPPCVVVLDVGQGDAILVRDGTHTLLVDTGPDETVLRRALARAGVRSLDGVVLTHAHEDHTGGLDGLAGLPRPAWIGVPDVDDADVDALAKRCVRRTSSVLRLSRDMTWTVGETKVRVLWPIAGERGLSANDTSVVLLVERDGRRILLLGDAEERAQREVLAVWSTRVDAVKVAHHGSPNGNVPAALAVWRPVAALISVGVGNRFGHPSAIALSTLATVGARVSRTDLEGDLTWRFESAAGVAQTGMAAAVCDNPTWTWSPGRVVSLGEWTDAWQLPTSQTSSPSISSTVQSRSCSIAPRSACAIGSRASPTSISTSNSSMAPRPPPRRS